VRTVFLVLHVPGTDPDDVYTRLADLARYPELTDTVRSVHITDVGDGTTTSTWEVTFRAGLLRWREEDVYDPAARTIVFRQLDGDLALFDGSWTCTADAGDSGGTRIAFDARLDLGIPSLADALEPIAVRALLENTAVIVRGLFPGAQVVDGARAVAASRA
jgi:ribosome-associated toxin RatA of RatAB toxin-antitoxin module